MKSIQKSFWGAAVACALLMPVGIRALNEFVELAVIVASFTNPNLRDVARFISFERVVGKAIDGISSRLPNAFEQEGIQLSNLALYAPYWKRERFCREIIEMRKAKAETPPQNYKESFLQLWGHAEQLPITICCNKTGIPLYTSDGYRAETPYMPATGIYRLGDRGDIGKKWRTWFDIGCLATIGLYKNFRDAQNKVNAELDAKKREDNLIARITAQVADKFAELGIGNEATRKLRQKELGEDGTATVRSRRGNTPKSPLSPEIFSAPAPGSSELPDSPDGIPAQPGERRVSWKDQRRGSLPVDSKLSSAAPAGVGLGLSLTSAPSAAAAGDSST